LVLSLKKKRFIKMNLKESRKEGGRRAVISFFWVKSKENLYQREREKLAECADYREIAAYRNERYLLSKTL